MNEAILGGILFAPQAIAKIEALLNPQAFYDCEAIAA